MPRNKYPEETERKIMETALRLFLDKGYEQTTVLDIIANLGGLTRGAFYHHFKSKDALLEAILEKYSNGSDVYEKAMTANVPNGLERIKLALKLALESNVSSNESIAIIGMVMSLLATPYFFTQRHKWMIEDSKVFAKMIEEGMSDGSIKKGNAKLMSELMMLLINHWTMPTIYPCTKEELLIKGEMIVQILAGIGFPVIDDEIEKLFFQTMDAIEWSTPV
ncbi:MAG: TetR/AcrR family transcriptional regulator [Defluviitaleaceae bacterium]|nr:TetR/AcrR family transcriptional regulator [Defluviitaleaceae bacterium]